MGKVAVVGDISAHPGAFAEYLELMRAHAAASREEPGCLRFDVLVPLEGGGRLLVYELFEHRAALEAHRTSARMEAFREKTRPLVKDGWTAHCDLVEPETVERKKDQLV